MYEKQNEKSLQRNRELLKKAEATLKAEKERSVNAEKRKEVFFRMM